MEIFANKGVFKPNEKISITVLADTDCHCLITVTSIDRIVGEYAFDFLAGENLIELPPMDCEFGGFGVKLRGNGGDVCCGAERRTGAGGLHRRLLRQRRKLYRGAEKKNIIVVSMWEE